MNREGTKAGIAEVTGTECMTGVASKTVGRVRATAESEMNKKPQIDRIKEEI